MGLAEAVIMMIVLHIPCLPQQCPVSPPTPPDDSMLTDNALRSLGRACRDLQHVYVAGCSRVSDQGVKALSHLKKLQVLNIADCNK